VSQGCSQTFLLIAFSLMPLAGAIAINFSSPLFATLISALVLKETVGLARWLALLVGFCGVLIVANPDAGTFQIGALFALANAVLYGSVTVGVRGMTATESAETLILYQLALLTAFFALLLPLGWAWPTPADTAWIVFNGVSNAVGQYWWTRALHLAPASAVAPFFYLSLVWASILGFAIWGDVPTISLGPQSSLRPVSSCCGARATHGRRSWPRPSERAAYTWLTSFCIAPPSALRHAHLGALCAKARHRRAGIAPRHW
jgi:drug/metabolite transporter (DMT)-like permease